MSLILLSALAASCIAQSVGTPAPSAPSAPGPVAARSLLPSESLVFRFGNAEPPRGMTGWRGATTGGAPLGAWVVESLPDAPSAPEALLLRQPAARGNQFNLCLFPSVTVQDVAVSAWLKPIAGDEDRGGGVAWRIQAFSGSRADNYYCARWNPLEDNFRIYLVKDGQRTQLASVAVKADGSTWHAVSVAHVGSMIEATLDGGSRLSVEDKTFPGPGSVGLWAKADAVTAFDDVSISDASPAPKSAPEQIRRDARMAAPGVASDLARQFLAAAADLPAVETRLVYFDREARKAYSAVEAAKLTEEQRGAMREIKGTPEFYYNTRYGSPLAYARLLDLLSAAGLPNIAGKRLVDFGYGGIGHLRLLASLGAQALGVDVDPTLVALYSEPGDTGVIPRSLAAPKGAPPGRIALTTGQWPRDIETVQALTALGPADLFVSKNTLKRGYVHPEREVDPRMLVHLGVSDEEFVKAVFDALRPGGMFLIYNICPAPSPADQPYKPWADGRCPFTRELLTQAGFEVVTFDAKDDRAAREQGRALGWDRGEQPMDLENDLFAWYTLAKRPVR